ncbi:MAG TPA: hypothetical protein VMH85_18775 [Terriglobales bacterium]|nr:hypothetical protein [Terriglobales bacterium]
MSTIGTLEKYLSLAADRQKLVVTNMANIDTPGYRTEDFDFRAELNRAVNSEASTTEGPMMHEVSGLVARPDGNNVNLDREGMALAETQMQFRIGVQLIRSEFHRLLTAITEGGK